MRIYSSILLSSMLIAGATTYQAIGDRLSLSLSLDPQIEIFAEGNNNGNKPCVRGGDRRECYSRFNLVAQLDHSIDSQTSEEDTRGSGRFIG